jgi:hypothetical protein
VAYTELAVNVGPDGHPEGNDWLHCRVVGRKWIGAGGPLMLDRLIAEFTSWANGHDS